MKHTPLRVRNASMKPRIAERYVELVGKLSALLGRRVLLELLLGLLLLHLSNLG